MLSEKYSFEELKMSSQLVRDLVAKDDKVKPLINQFFDEKSIVDQIAHKSFSSEKRQILVDVLQSQNEQASNKSKENIRALLNEDTYTVTTGHQLNLLTGPLYSIYKIAQCVDMANRLNQSHSNNHFVPVFWMATEDHDFEEINHLHIFGQKHEWNKEGQKEVITGRITTDGMDEFIASVNAKFQDPKALEVVSKLTAVYKDQGTLAEATRAIVNHLFGDYGIVVLDGDDAFLKGLFAEKMKKEIEEEVGFQHVMKTNEYLGSYHYHQQVYVRNINLFYIEENGKRERIKVEEDGIYVGDQKKSKEDLVSDVMANPANYSPNALYRPLYQETILPNLVYIGGGGELAYWMQIKSLFEAQDELFPMLRLRDSFLLYNTKQVDLMKDNEISLMDLKLGVDQIVKDIAIKNTESELSLSDALAKIEESRSLVEGKAEAVNPGLKQMVEGEFVKIVKVIEKIEGKLVKAEKGKHEQLQKKLIRLREQFFPAGGFQERHENMISYYMKDQQFIAKLIEQMNSFEEAGIYTIES